jgi:hypothetical protein
MSMIHEPIMSIELSIPKGSRPRTELNDGRNNGLTITKGYCGSHVVETFLSTGYKVCGVAHSASKLGYAVWCRAV